MFIIDNPSIPKYPLQTFQVRQVECRGSDGKRYQGPKLSGLNFVDFSFSL